MLLRQKFKPAQQNIQQVPRVNCPCIPIYFGSYSKLSQGHKEAFCCPDCVVTGGLPSKEVGFIAYESEFYWKFSIHTTDHNQTVRIIHVFCNQNRLDCRRFYIL